MCYTPRQAFTSSGVSSMITILIYQSYCHTPVLARWLHYNLESGALSGDSGLEGGRGLD